MGHRVRQLRGRSLPPASTAASLQTPGRFLPPAPKGRLCGWHFRRLEHPSAVQFGHPGMDHPYRVRRTPAQGTVMMEPGQQIDGGFFRGSLGLPL